MSYRTFKHLLGETSLERKCRIIFGGGILALITLSFYLYGRKTESLVIGQSRQAARMQVEPILERIHLLGISLVNDDLGPLANDMKSKFSTQKNESDSHVVKPFDDNPEYQPRTDFERAALKRFIKAAARQREEGHTAPSMEPYQFPDGTPTEHDELRPETTEYAYVQAVLFRPECFTSCHPGPSIESEIPSMTPFRKTLVGTETLEAGTLESASIPLPTLSGSIDGHHTMIRLDDGPKWTRAKPGDLAGVVFVNLPMEQTDRAINRNRAILIATALVTAILAMFASWTIVRYIIVRPVKHLRDVSDAIAAGKLTIRSRIQTGDEFEELSHAFNRMLHNLVAMQQELRNVNGDLDRKVDELAQANMALYEMNRIKSDFLATMSHELRTPLNSIIGFSEVLAGSDQLEEKQRRYASNIQTSGKMLLNMINDILDLAKIESGKMEVRAEDFSVRDICESLTAQMRPLAERKGVDLMSRLDEAIPLVRQDQGKFRQIIYNLLSNAIKFTPESGRITVTAWPDGRFVKVSVSDNGIGIASKDQEAIFEKFRQAGGPDGPGSVLTRAHEGTGLGLSIVREFCRMLGGEIELDSELGRGSTFTIRIPQRLPGDRKQEVAIAHQGVDLSKARRIEHHPMSTDPAGPPNHHVAGPPRRSDRTSSDPVQTSRSD